MRLSIDNNVVYAGAVPVATVQPERTIPVLISQGRAPVAARLIAHGAPPQFASAVSLVGWAAAWDVVERAVFERAVRWRMGS